MEMAQPSEQPAPQLGCALSGKIFLYIQSEQFQCIFLISHPSIIQHCGKPSLVFSITYPLVLEGSFYVGSKAIFSILKSYSFSLCSLGKCTSP